MSQEQPTYELDRGIAVEQRAPGEYAVHLDAGWVVGGGVNGGYVLAVVGNALREQLAPAGHPDPLTVSAHYLSPSVPGPGTVRVTVRRQGRGRSTVQATLSQPGPDGDVDRVLVTGVYGALSDNPERLREHPPQPLPPRERCLAMADAPPEVRRVGPLLERFATRLDPAYAGWALGKPSGAGVIQGWFALVDHRPLDPVSLLLVVDALPPATMDLGRLGWAPTLELTAHVRARPAPGWATVRHETRTLVDGSFEEDCWVWDADGHLVAQSRQLALLPRDPS
jgi:hypothetical protein